MQTKLEVLPESHNSQENAYVLYIDVSALGAKNARRKYTQRRHWLEKSGKRGYRSCYQSYDSVRNYWCNPVKGTYSRFLALKPLFEDNKLLDIVSIGFSDYQDAEKIRAFADKYALSDNQLKEVLDHADTKETIGKIIDSHREEQIKRAEEKKRGLDSYTIGTPYSLHEINKCTDNMDLLKVSVTGYAVRRKCRKNDYFNDTICYALPLPDDKKQTANEIIEKTLEKIKRHLADTYRTIEVAKIEVKEVELMASREVGGFYGMRQNLFGDSLASQNVELL